MKTVKSILLKRVKTLLIASLVIISAIAISSFRNSESKTSKVKVKKTAAIIVGHGGVPRDFPKLKEYFKLHDKGGKELESLEKELLYWPRTEQNDAYWAGFMKVVKEVEKADKFSSVHAAFNEMCAPTVEEALNEAIKNSPDEIVITSIMVTPGGGHSEQDIPKAIEAFKKKNPGIKVIYAWPYDPADISNMLIKQISKFSKSE